MKFPFVTYRRRSHIKFGPIGLTFFVKGKGFVMKMPITVTERAFERLSEIRSESGQGVMLRVAVLGGGCSGFQYEITLTEERLPGDMEISDGKSHVLVDDVSQPFLAGAAIDFEDALVGSRFIIENPNAVSSCGCGTSFSI